ncbi:hypothetical protein [Mizugakiibacter sediminis]|uniref:hypothetical protein n=1 Tax=Mizugakiibacter sediminis TaxID=1475481 RepID=UPI0011E4CF38|nr:hypothetical protein [Mizugakiibacter sediminis]
MRILDASALIFSILIAFAMTLSGEAKASEKNCAWTPTAELVDKIEAGLEMPRGHPLQAYRRYYSGEASGGHHVVIAVFLKSDHPGVEVVPRDKLPRILDGGCSVMHLRYDVESQKVLMLICSGVA